MLELTNVASRKGKMISDGRKKPGNTVYRIQKQDIAQAAQVLADAFQHDPLWNKICEGESDLNKRFQAIFEVPVRQCFKYGEVYAPSEALEGIIGWVPEEYADMTPWRIIRSGAMGAAMRMGMNVSKKMGAIFKPITQDRKEHMAGYNYLYLLIVGVTTKLQGKGFGRKLIYTAIEESEREGLELYLETETEENVAMYEHFGFRLLKKITLPIVELPMWEMARKPT
jgi:GNAT superfamily N-acetyltransferase